jgi:hypothetical protein
MPKQATARWIGRVAVVSFAALGIAFGWQASSGVDRTLGSLGVLEQGDSGWRQGALLFLKAALDRLDADVNRTDPDSPVLRSLRAEQDAVVLRMREVAWPLSGEGLPREVRFLVEHEPRAPAKAMLAAVPDIPTGGAAVPVELKVGHAAGSPVRDLALPRDPALSRVPQRPAPESTADNSAELQPAGPETAEASARTWFPQFRETSNALSASNEGFASPAQTESARAAAEIAVARDVPKEHEPIAEAPQASGDRELANGTEPPQPSPVQKTVPLIAPRPLASDINENTRPASQAPTASVMRQEVPSADVGVFVARGDPLLAIGDIASARLFYERAAAVGDGRGTLRMGMTFDPAFLRRAELHGVAVKQGAELRAQLTHATEQLKASQGRISQLEGQLKQAPSAADLDKAGKQGAELRAQLAQATDQLKTSQGRISQLEGQLKQAPSAADLADARKEIGDLRSQLSTANGMGEGRGSQIGAAKSSPPGTPAKAVVARANDETSADVSMLLNRGDALLSTGDIASGRLFYQRAAEAGNGQAALRLGNTYDPAFLERAQLRVHGDRALALFWYQRARELGASEAEILLRGAQAQSER